MPRGVVRGAVVNLVALQAVVAAEVVPMGGKDQIFVPQLRVGPGQQGGDVLGGDVAQRVLDRERGLGAEADGMEVAADGGGLELVVVLAGGGEQLPGGRERQPALHGDVAGVLSGALISKFSRLRLPTMTAKG